MERNLRKERVGLVVSDKMDKTVVVEVIDKAFGKRIRCVICGGAPLSKKIRELFKKKNLEVNLNLVLLLVNIQVYLLNLLLK